MIYFNDIFNSCWPLGTFSESVPSLALKRTAVADNSLPSIRTGPGALPTNNETLASVSALQTATTSFEPMFAARLIGDVLEKRVCVPRRNVRAF
jgi:hypothetical protein